MHPPAISTRAFHSPLCVSAPLREPIKTLFLLTLAASLHAADPTLLIGDNFTGPKDAPIPGRTPDTANTPDGKWTALGFAPTGGSGGFQAVVLTDNATSAPAVDLVCNGDSSGEIAIPLATFHKSPISFETSRAWFQISAALRGADPSLGFYSALHQQDPAGGFDAFTHFTGLRLGADGSLTLYRNGEFISSVPFTGSFDKTLFHTLSYNMDTAAGLISNVKLEGSTSDYSSFTIPGLFTPSSVTYAAVAALCESGGNNQAFAQHFLVAVRPGSPPPAPALIAKAPAASAPASIIVHDGDRIAFLGDSITAQGDSPKGYIRLVIAGLKAEGVNAVPIPAGHPGDTSANLLGRINHDVLHRGANWMTLSCAGNDILLQPRGFGVDLDIYKKNIAKLVVRAQDWSIKVILFTGTPLGEDAASQNNQAIAGYNDFIRKFAADNHLPLADMNTAFWKALNAPPDPGAIPGRRLFFDSVHPNETGQMIMAKTLLKTLGVPDADMPKVEKAMLDSEKQ